MKAVGSPLSTSMAKLGPFMLAVREKGMFSVMKAPSSLIPFAWLMTSGCLSAVYFFISLEKLTMALDGMTRKIASASANTL